MQPVRPPNEGLPIIRVGMPLPSGRLLEHGVASGLPLMFSANAFSRYKDGRFAGFRLAAAQAIPASCDAALDSAGFTAAAHYGDYLFTAEAYLELAATRSWAFYSSMDMCCEDQVAPDIAMRRVRVDTTIARFMEVANLAAKRGLPAPLPVIQGRFPAEYLRCAREMGIDNDTRLIGLGSVCRRHLHGPDGVLAILDVLDRELPSKVQLHLFGLKGAGTLGVLTARYPGRIYSTDSMAWDASVRRACPVGRTQEMRAEAMQQWYWREMRQLQDFRSRPLLVFPAAGDESSEAVAIEALGKALGDLIVSGDITYQDAKAALPRDAAVVKWLMASQGAEAFAGEDAEDDYGLGTVVYHEIRTALCDRGLLAAS